MRIYSKRGLVGSGMRKPRTRRVSGLKLSVFLNCYMCYVAPAYQIEWNIQLQKRRPMSSTSNRVVPNTLLKTGGSGLDTVKEIATRPVVNFTKRNHYLSFEVAPQAG
jgi:hypothetical protein